MKFYQRICVFSAFVLSMYLFSWMVAIPKLYDLDKTLSGPHESMKFGWNEGSKLGRTEITKFGRNLQLISPLQSVTPSGTPTEEELKFNKTLVDEILSKPVVTPIKHTILINNHKICKKTTPYLIILVPSAPQNTQKRDAIRESYAKLSSDRISGVSDRPIEQIVRVVFLLGTSDRLSRDFQNLESNNNGDIIQFDFVDSYQNLTLKILNGFRWVVENCGKVRYILKADDDVFVNVIVLLDVLKSYTVPPRGAVFGFIYGGGQVWRHGMWAVSRDDYPKDFYPAYASGTAYLLTRNLLEDIISIAERKNYFRVEDVYITGIIASDLLGARLVNIPGASEKNQNATKPCDIVSSRMVFKTNLQHYEILNVWKTLISYSLVCSHDQQKLK